MDGDACSVSFAAKALRWCTRRQRPRRTNLPASLTFPRSAPVVPRRLRSHTNEKAGIVRLLTSLIRMFSDASMQNEPGKETGPVPVAWPDPSHYSVKGQRSDEGITSTAIRRDSASIDEHPKRRRNEEKQNPIRPVFGAPFPRGRKKRSRVVFLGRKATESGETDLGVGEEETR
ncbi:hypothetical protein GW17_00013847 [Ensete ventricosum]|nr:hypothetical protein GW17_00013847 [Ensete ventricosum]